MRCCVGEVSVPKMNIPDVCLPRSVLGHKTGGNIGVTVNTQLFIN